MLAMCSACLTFISQNPYNSSLRLIVFPPLLTGEEIET